MKDVYKRQDMMKAVAKEYDCELKEVLTGFKWIGREILESEKAGHGHFEFGMEESYGCLTGIYARDKDCLLYTSGPLSALPAISMILSTIGLWTHDMRKTRILFLLNSPPLILYNIMIHSYSCFFIECCAFISYIIAVYRFDVKKYKVKALAKQRDEILTED